MAITAEDAVKAFEDCRQASVPYKEVKAKLSEQGATHGEAAIALVAALDKHLLYLDKTGQLTRIQ